MFAQGGTLPIASFISDVQCVHYFEEASRPILDQNKIIYRPKLCKRII
jgi:hypothetical protein